VYKSQGRGQRESEPSLSEWSTLEFTGIGHKKGFFYKQDMYKKKQ
jgi:hypothetical protein